MFERPSLGITGTTTLLTGNVGGGVNGTHRMAAGGCAATTGSCRFGPNESAPVFFGQETRYGHRVYGAVLINAVR